MPLEPEIKSLSYKKRQFFFLILLGVFIVMLPIFIFYSSGYRLSFENEETTIVSTGGIYVTADNLEVEVYIDEERVQRPRLFRNAYYIQNLNTGPHRVVVQGEGLQTWVKILPVDANIVTEAAAFNMPTTPFIRPIPEFLNQEGQGVYVVQSTSTDLFPKASTTDTFVLLTKVATSTLRENSEFTFVEDLFLENERQKVLAETIRNRLNEEIERFRFSTTTSTSTEVATSTMEEVFVERSNMRLVQKEDELFAKWIGSQSSIPHYFCVPQSASSTIADRLGLHVAEQFSIQALSTTTPLVIENNRMCRTEIRIDRKWQKIRYYAFFPRSSDLVVLQLEDGLYVTEIDDRAWQNTQLIYPGDSFEAFVTDTNIYIKENDTYFELLTRLETTP